MYCEPHTIKRYLIDYPTNFVHLLVKIVRREVTINVTYPERLDQCTLITEQ